MNPMIPFATKWLVTRQYHFLAALLSAAVAGTIIAFPLSFVSGMNVLLGLSLIPFAISFYGGQRFNAVYLILMIFLGIIAFNYNVRTFYFLAVAFYVFYLLEAFIGKINSLALFLLLFMSPFFHQVSVILGFPIRMQLSQWAGDLLSVAGFQIQVDGNTITLDGNIFSVDEACMGLSMLAISMLMGVAAIAHAYKRKGLQLSFFYLTIFFSLVFLFNLISNLFRIVVLIIFRIMPETFMHDVVGVFCMMLYVVAPLYILSQWMTKKFGRSPQQRIDRRPIFIYSKLLMTVLAMSILIIAVRIEAHRKSPRTLTHAKVSLPDVHETKMAEGITKLYNADMLVYVKPIPEFFTGEHTPLLCWKGSGYEFRSVRKTIINGNEVYLAKLEKHDGKLFTAWWYSNGEVITIDQWDWRLRMLKGEKKFSLVNLTCQEEKALTQHLDKIFRNGWLTIEKYD
jgi:exosortase N